MLRIQPKNQDAPISDTLRKLTEQFEMVVCISLKSWTILAPVKFSETHRLLTITLALPSLTSLGPTDQTWRSVSAKPFEKDPASSF